MKKKKKLSKKQQDKLLNKLSDQWNFYPKTRKKYRFRGWSDILD